MKSGMTLARLMRESADRVDDALRSDNDAEQMVASRIVESPDGFQRWEHEHSNLMRGVAGYSVLRTQVTVLKQTTLNLIHGKALFEYLRKKEVRGVQRTALIRHFYPNRGYTAAMVSAHGSYVRKACSFLCASHVGSEVVHDEVFIDPMHHYEDLYADYFDLYCRLQTAAGIDSACERALLPLLKHQLNELRWGILNPRQGPPKIRRDAQQRRTDQTGRQPTLRLANGPGN